MFAPEFKLTLWQKIKLWFGLKNYDVPLPTKIIVPYIKKPFPKLSRKIIISNGIKCYEDEMDVV